MSFLTSHLSEFSELEDWLSNSQDLNFVVYLTWKYCSKWYIIT